MWGNSDYWVFPCMKALTTRCFHSIGWNAMLDIFIQRSMSKWYIALRLVSQAKLETNRLASSQPLSNDIFSTRTHSCTLSSLSLASLDMSHPTIKANKQWDNAYQSQLFGESHHLAGLLHLCPLQCFPWMLEFGALTEKVLTDKQLGTLLHW